MTSPAFPTADTPLQLDGPAGAIEARVEVPEADVAALPVVAVLCHPLPTEGGTMHNKVVTMAARALRESGVTTVRFNFRGTGASAGAYDHGDGERDDLRAVVAWVREQRPDARVWLAGFSFGAFVSLRCAAELAPALLVSIAPPAGRSWDFESIEPPTCPWVVIQGEADEVVEPQDVYDWLERIGERLAEPPLLIRIPDTSHFFHGKLMDLRGAVRTAIRPFLPGAAG